MTDIGSHEPHVLMYSAAEMVAMLQPYEIGQLNEWLARGDSIAVYTNHDFLGTGLAHTFFVSFGSDTATIPSRVPPTTCPDIDGMFYKYYVLDGTYTGPALVAPETAPT